MSNTVRKQKSGDQLSPGDWLAPGELLDGAAEVLYAHSYPAAADSSRDNDGKHVHVVSRAQGTTVPFSDIVAGNTLFDLASEEDLAELREAAKRTQKIAELRALAAWLEERPWLPIPGLHCNDHLYGLDGYRKVVELAARTGGKLDTRLDDRTVAKFDEGPLSYSVIAWHDKGRPAEPTPEPVADPTGLAYTRADDGPDDPTPVSPARVPLHTGAVTDEGLVDETDYSVEMRAEDAGRVANPRMAHFFALKEETRRVARHFLGLEESAEHNRAGSVEVAAATVDAELVDVPRAQTSRCPSCGHWQEGGWRGRHNPEVGCGALAGSCGCTYAEAW